MPWGVVYYRAADGRVPADDFPTRCPDKVEATIFAVLEAMRRAPPPPKELAERGFAGPQIVVINGMDKPSGQVFSDADYRRHVRKPTGGYLSTLPRRIAT
ncbi:MAG TPA: hypothetical protein VE972_05165 [Conexibacter sp.]|nr:hypothetical protein [Conexibacter sp.]